MRPWPRSRRNQPCRRTSRSETAVVLSGRVAMSLGGRERVSDRPPVVARRPPAHPGAESAHRSFFQSAEGGLAVPGSPRTVVVSVRDLMMPGFLAPDAVARDGVDELRARRRAAIGATHGLLQPVAQGALVVVEVGQLFVANSRRGAEELLRGMPVRSASRRSTGRIGDRLATDDQLDLAFGFRRRPWRGSRRRRRRR
jgi:hypothetical protein